jgi:hypothetical protein
MLGRIGELIYWPLIHTTRGTTSNYRPTANLHNSQVTTAPAKPFPGCCVFTSRSLATASNSGDSSASRTPVPTSPTPVQKSLGQSQSYFTTGGLPQISWSWRQSSWYSRPAFFSQLNTFGNNPYVTSSLTRGWGCRLQLLLTLARGVILRPESRGTHGHILVSQIRDPPTAVQPEEEPSVPIG